VTSDLYTYTLWALYYIGKLNLKFNQQNYVDFFFNLSTNESRPSFVARPITGKKCVESVTLENGMGRLTNLHKGRWNAMKVI